MPFLRPTLTTIRQQVRQDLVAAVEGGANLLRRAVLTVLGDAQAGLAHLHYGYLDWIARQSVPFTATDEALEGWAALKGVTRKPAAAAGGLASFSGVPGAVIPAGTAVVRAADGLAYTTRKAVAVGAGGTASVALVADAAGAVGNADAGVAVALSRAIAGVQSSGIAGMLTGGADSEDDADLRTRMLEVFRLPAQGGDADDYVVWAKAVPGVTRAWCRPNGMGLGSVVVYVMLDDAQAAHDGFPQGTNGTATAETRAGHATGDQLAVADALWPLQPVTALVYVVAPAPAPVALTIRGVPVGLRDAVRDALVERLRADAIPGGTVAIDRLWDAVTGAMGGVPFDIDAPADDIPAATGHMLTLGPITWS